MGIGISKMEKKMVGDNQAKAMEDLWKIYEKAIKGPLQGDKGYIQGSSKSYVKLYRSIQRTI